MAPSEPALDQPGMDVTRKAPKSASKSTPIALVHKPIRSHSERARLDQRTA